MDIEWVELGSVELVDCFVSAKLSGFPIFRYITMMPRMRQALVEFEVMEDAINCVQMCQVRSRHLTT